MQVFLQTRDRQFTVGASELPPPKAVEHAYQVAADKLSKFGSAISNMPQRGLKRLQHGKPRLTVGARHQPHYDEALPVQDGKGLLRPFKNDEFGEFLAVMEVVNVKSTDRQKDKNGIYKDITRADHYQVTFGLARRKKDFNPDLIPTSGQLLRIPCLDDRSNVIARKANAPFPVKKENLGVENLKQFTENNRFYSLASPATGEPDHRSVPDRLRCASKVLKDSRSLIRALDAFKRWHRVLTLNVVRKQQPNPETLHPCSHTMATWRPGERKLVEMPTSSAFAGFYSPAPKTPCLIVANGIAEAEVYSIVQTRVLSVEKEHGNLGEMLYLGQQRRGNDSNYKTKLENFAKDPKNKLTVVYSTKEYGGYILDEKKGSDSVLPGKLRDKELLSKIYSIMKLENSVIKSIGSKSFGVSVVNQIKENIKKNYEIFHENTEEIDELFSNFHSSGT